MGAYGLWLTSLLFASGIGISALPTENFSNGVLLDDIDTLYNPHANHSKRADDFYLRPLALGASITWGLTSSDGNGYRKHLRDALRYDGWRVNMVGHLKGGSMNDNDVEGVSGYVIDQVSVLADSGILYQPNVILINAGTNDMGGKDGVDPATAPQRMDNLLNKLYDKIPGTTVILSTLLPSCGSPNDVNTPVYNIALRQMILTRQAAGQKIVLADMESAISTVDLIDCVHPNAAGYKIMAAVWFKAVQVAESAGFLTPPAATAYDDEATNTGSYDCAKVNGDTAENRRQILTQKGSGEDDGIYVHKSEFLGTAIEITRANAPNGFWFANIFGSGLDDMIEYYNDTPGLYRIFRALGSGKWSEMVTLMDVGDACLARGVKWGDINADGKDDFYCIAVDGQAYVSINQGDGSDSKPPSFIRIGSVKVAESGYLQASIRIADIDGDGRADYCGIGSNGDIHCWRNGGQGTAPTTAYNGAWQDMGIVFTGKNKGNIDGVVFTDLNGDRRDDWLWLSDTGQVSTYTNSRGTAEGFAPDWLDAGITHNGMSEAGARPKIRFARALGAWLRKSYIYIVDTEVDSGIKYEFKLWGNYGGGGTKLKGDGNRYCDMTGSGSDDYLWVASWGDITMFENIQNPPEWGHNGKIFTIPGMTELTNEERKSIHFADFDGDGKCDIARVTKATGEVQVWLNQYNGVEFLFNDMGLWSGAARCTQGWGYGLFDLGLRFADIDGDGKADYLCMEKDSRVTGFLNKGQGNFQDVGQIKLAIDVIEGETAKTDRANMRWADNGDGKADLLWIDKTNGNTKVWLNGGMIPSSGSSFYWPPQGQLWTGPGTQGHNIYFPSVGYQRRADMHQVVPITNIAYTWFNECAGGGGGDDGDITDPGLPNIPTNTSPVPGSGSGGGSDGGSGDGGSSGGHSDYTPDPSKDNQFPSCDALYNTLEELAADAGSIPLLCGVHYTLPILQRMLNDALEEYNAIMADGYNNAFNIYSDYIVDTSVQALTDFITEKGDDYFTCQVVEEIRCCSSCEFADEVGSCRWCTEENCDLISNGGSQPGSDITYANTTQVCPTDYSQRGLGDHYDQTVTWNLKNSDAKDFKDAVFAEIGAKEDKVHFAASPCPDCFVTDRECVLGTNPPASCYYHNWWFNRPLLQNFNQEDVLNPKDVFDQGLGNINTLVDDLSVLYFTITSGMYVNQGFSEDIVDAVSLPIFMVQDSIDYMKEVVRMANEIEASETKMLILNLLSALFFIIPAVGSTLAASGFAQLGRVLVWLGEIGGTALGIEGVISDPSTAPLLIFGLIMSAKGIKDVGGTVKAANLRRGMSTADVSAFSTSVSQNLARTNLVVSRYGKYPVCETYR